MLTDYCAQFHDIATITVIANGCTDNTVQIVQSLRSEFNNLEVLVINGRIGKGGAIRAGLHLGDEPYIAFADADGSTSATEFLRLFDSCLRMEADGIIGSRWLPGALVEPPQPLMRRVASRAFNMLSRWLFRLPFADTQCGAKIFKREAVRAVLSSLEIAGFAFDIDLLYKMHRKKFRIIEAATHWADRAAGTKVHIIRTSLKMLQTILRIRLQQSSLWHLPFAEFFARDAVIPVKKRTRVLVLSNPLASPPSAAHLHAALCNFEERGYAVVFASEIFGTVARGNQPFGAIGFTIGFLRWYVSRGHREYDAILEIAGDSPFWIPVFSSKTTVVLHDSSARLSAVASWIYRTWYQHSAFIDYAGEWEENALAITGALLDAVGFGRLYGAAFHESPDGWTLYFTDMQSGDVASQLLN